MHSEHQQNNNIPMDCSPEDTDEINLLDLLLVLAKRWRMIVGVPLVVAVITAIITLFMPNIYTAKTMIIPSDDSSGGMGAALMSQLGGLAGLAGGLGGKTTSDLYVTMLTSGALQDPIIDTFKLMDRFETKYRADVYKRLNTMSKVSLGKKDGVITITVDDKDPKFAAAVANMYVSELGKLASGLNMAQAGQNAGFYQKRIAETKTDLDKATEALKQFQQKNKVIAPTDQAQSTIASIAQLKGQLAVQEVQLAALLSQFTDNNQEVKNARASIANLRGQISRLEGAGSGGAIPGVALVPALGEEYLKLMRDFKIQEAVLEMLTKQYEVSQLNQTKDLAPFQVLEKARVPERKSKPKRALIVMLAAVSAGFLMILLAFLQEAGERMSLEDRQRWDQIRGFLPTLPKSIVRLWERCNAVTLPKKDVT